MKVSNQAVANAFVNQVAHNRRVVLRYEATGMPGKAIEFKRSRKGSYWDAGNGGGYASEFVVKLDDGRRMVVKVKVLDK